MLLTVNRYGSDWPKERVNLRRARIPVDALVVLFDIILVMGGVT